MSQTCHLYSSVQSRFLSGGCRIQQQLPFYSTIKKPIAHLQLTTVVCPCVCVCPHKYHTFAADSVGLLVDSSLSPVFILFCSCWIIPTSFVDVGSLISICAS